MRSSRRSLDRLALAAIAAAACLLGAAPGARAHDSMSGSDADSHSVYPTDQCAAEKLRAAGNYCAAAVQAWRHGMPETQRLAWARRALDLAWRRAELHSAEAGVSCEDTTVSADEMIQLLDDGAASLADALDPSDGMCRSRRISQAASVCRQLLQAEGQHLLLRSVDRERRLLDLRRQTALERLRHVWDAGRPSWQAHWPSWLAGWRGKSSHAPQCDGGPSADEGVALVEGLARDAFEAVVVSPAVSTDWTEIDPPDQVTYGDRVLEPICSRGTPWHFYARRGSVNKLIVYYQGGGACWSYLTCNPFAPVFKESVGPGDDPSNATHGFADFDNPDNPFRDWNAVFVPYCTGDVHWGDAVVTYDLNGHTTTIHHKGYVNAQVAEKWAREHFVEPDQVFVTGSSAGAYGAIVNSLPLKEHAYPSTPFAVLGDAGNGVITQDFLVNDLSKWGIEKNLPAWIPALNVPITQLNASDLWTESALFYPDSRFANYSTAYDGGTGGQTGFYNIMLSGDDVAQFFLWWRPSCEWNEIMRSLVQASAARAPNYRYYIGTGSRHTMWGSDKVYTDTTGGVPTIVSWLDAMLTGSPDWVNVECQDCGHLLPGDPRPDPAQYTAEQRLPYVTDPGTGETQVECPAPMPMMAP